MRKSTRIDLDMTLVAEAATILDTKEVDETVDAALREVIASRRRRLIDLGPDLTLERLDMDRMGRDSLFEAIAQRLPNDPT